MLTSFVHILLAINFIYSSPIREKILLAGNFGEPRPNHFHCGIDIKTGGVEGKCVMSTADGFISRITVGLDGFGNALYITHPDGNTSVYCHLKSYAPKISTLLRKWQYSHESYIADVRLKPTDCPVVRGQFVGISGNSGSSQAPHLHFELHDTRSGELLDPLNVLMPYIRDTTSPLAHAFMAYPVQNEGIFEGATIKRSYRFNSHKLSRHFTAWGKVGFGIWANDYTNDTYNKLGVKEIYLKVDGKEVYKSTIDNFSSTYNRLVNLWGDYENYFRSGIWYLKSFRTPGNTLPFISTDENYGIINFNKEKEYSIEYILKDFNGNISQYEFIVDARKVTIPKVYNMIVPSVKRNVDILTSSYPGVYMIIPQWALNGNKCLSIKQKTKSDSLNNYYSFYNGLYPPAIWAEIGLAVRNSVKDPTKLYIASIDGKYYGGKFDNGWITAPIREFGNAYGLEYDDQPPTVKPIGRNKWSNNKTIKFAITDNGSGIKTVKGYIDGQFILLERIDKTNTYICKLQETPLKRNFSERKIEVVAIDNKNNKIIILEKIVY